jgi:hypothetical protein
MISDATKVHQELCEEIRSYHPKLYSNPAYVKRVAIKQAAFRTVISPRVNLSEFLGKM